MRKVLVTGGAGFIGSQVVDAYLAEGDRVWILDDLSTGRKENVNPRAEFVHAAIQSKTAHELFDRVGGFDIVNHHAAQMDVRRSVADPRYDASVNIDGFLNIVTNAQRTGVKRFIFISSGGVIYGEPETRPTPEQADKLPLSPYGVSKLTAEYYLFYYHRVHGLDYVACRYANVYGPRQDPAGEAGVVAIFCNAFGAGQSATIYGDGEQTRDYVYVEDVVRANVLLSEAALAPAAALDDRAFNVGTGQETTVNRLAEIIREISGRRTSCTHAPERRGELRHSALNIAKLQALGWDPRTDLKTGLRKTYEQITQRVNGKAQ